MRCSVMNKNWFTVFNVKVTVRAYNAKYDFLKTISSKLLVRLQPNLVW